MHNPNGVFASANMSNMLTSKDILHRLRFCAATPSRKTDHGTFFDGNVCACLLGLVQEHCRQGLPLTLVLVLHFSQV